MINKSASKQSSDPIKALAKRFKCPITHFIMEYPVMAADGFTYERAAITEWIKTQGARVISPSTGEGLVYHDLVPNITLRNIIQKYLELQPTLRQKKLTEQDIRNAIRIRDEEIQAMLEKRERQVSRAQAERDSIVQQLGPMEQEITRLRTENQELNDQVIRSKSLLANAVLDGGNRVDLPNIGRHIEEQRQQAVDLTRYLEKRLPKSLEPKFFAKKPEAKPIQPPVDPSQVEQLLKHIIRGEQDEAEAMLQKTPALACATGNITDLSERTFAGITALQYAVWALDWHMWTMILKYLPPSAAREQCLVFQNNSAPWIVQHGKHFDLNPLIRALQTYSSEYAKWNYNKRCDYWCKTIGGLQRQLPAHVINEYCRPDRSFDPTPSFKEATLPRRGYVDTSGKEYGLDWLFTERYEGGRCGEGWAVGRVGWQAANGRGGWCSCAFVECELQSLDRCRVTRTQQVEELFDNLNLTTGCGLYKMCNLL